MTQQSETGAALAAVGGRPRNFHKVIFLLWLLLPTKPSHSGKQRGKSKCLLSLELTDSLGSAHASV